ncbi:MAG: hypothetical protein ACRELY_31170 [Polyangiaceae bacterium]
MTAALALGLFGAAACSSSSSASDDSSSGDSGTDGTTGGGDSGANKDSGITDDPDNCVKPGTGGNSLGIGGYCTPLGGQCDDAGPGGAPRICTAEVSGTPAHAWFCTYPCEHTSDCGEGAVCFQNVEGSGCVPTACLYLDVDAGHVIVDDAGDGGDGG